MTRQTRTTKSRKKYSKSQNIAPELTFMDHVKELQGRLFAVAVAFVLVAGAAYPFFDKIVNVLLAPLGENHELVYLTPGGAFGFIIQVCMYVGLVGALPVIVYHLYKFLMPAVKPVNARRVIGYTIASFGLAMLGIAFAYFISLPAALYFLTGFDLYHINPMLTIDSYFGFVMAYMIAGALLFQLPLVLMIIDSIKPQSPRGLMKYQQHIIVGSFVVAAIISPTPDALNQTLLAAPIIVMYQIGIVIIWFKHRRANKKTRVQEEGELLTEYDLARLAGVEDLGRAQAVSAAVHDREDAISTASQAARPASIMSIDGFVPTSRTGRSLPLAPPRDNLTRSIPSRPSGSSGHVPPATRSLDGFII